MEEKIFLTDENGEEIEFELITKIETDEKLYAILQPAGEEEAYIFIVEEDEDGKLNLTEIEDDEEFEMVSELYLQEEE